MPVYVDDMYLHAMGQFGRMKMSHMIADTDDELHAMATRIGVARRWHQAPPKHDSHYDISISKRALAIAAGAVPVSLRTLACMSSYRRFSGQSLPAPDEAERKMKELRPTAAETRQVQGSLL